MEVFSLIKGITQGQPEKLNGVRRFMRVITIADLANPDGTHSPTGCLLEIGNQARPYSGHTADQNLSKRGGPFSDDASA